MFDSWNGFLYWLMWTLSLVGVPFVTLYMIVQSLLAARKGYRWYLWTIACGLIGLIILGFLPFANKEEEYRYEIDRNDTHRMLVQVLLKDKRGGDAIDVMVDQAVAAAATLRTQAEAQASRREHEAAVKTLEESTRELVQAIRSAGVYIPG